MLIQSIFLDTLTRESKEGYLDLRFGNPGFLFKFWDIYNESVNLVSKGSNMSYLPTHLEAELESKILELHKKTGNLPTHKPYVVFGNGATQLIHAIFLVMRELGITRVNFEPPYYPRFMSLAELSDLKYSKTATKNTCELITSPNNPDCHLSLPKENKPDHHVIYDLTYNWPHYTETVHNYDNYISIYSLGKLSGHASTRIGWALVPDPKIASRIAYYVEILTNGTSADAIKHAISIIDHINIHHSEFFQLGKSELNKRWIIINQLLSKNNSIKIESNSGMFLYGKYLNSRDYWDDNKIQVVNGDMLGVSKDYFRVNIGGTIEQFNEFIKRVKGSF